MSWGYVSALTLPIGVIQEGKKLATGRFCPLGEFLKKNCTTEITIFVQYIYGLEETCWEQFEVKAGYMLRAIHLANQRRISLRKFKYSLFTQYHSTKELKTALFLYLWKSSVFLKLFGASHLSVTEIMVKQRGNTKRIRKPFISKR